MAAAKRIVHPPSPPDQIVLTLSLGEANTLRDILAKVSGNAELSRRRYTEQIRVALESVGVHWVRRSRDMRRDDQIHFNDDTWEIAGPCASSTT